MEEESNNLHWTALKEPRILVFSVLGVFVV